MKIAVFHNLPGGGSVRFVNKTTKYLSGKHQVEVYTITEDKKKIWKNKILQIKEKKIIVRPWKGFIARNLWIIFCLWKKHKDLADEINKKKYHCILVHPDYFTKSPYILRFLKIKKIYVLNEPPREFYEPKNIHSPTWKNKIVNIIRIYIKWLDKSNTKNANIIIANSKYTQKIIKKIYNLKSYILYPGVDNKKFKPNRNKRYKQILMIGSLKKYKGHYFAVKSLAKLLTKKYQIIIVGDGKKEDKNFIRQQVPANLQKNINFIDRHIDDSSLIKLYRESKVLCIGAHNEPFGMTSIEAQACGTPVIAVSEGGVIETIKNGETGYLVKRVEKEFEKKTIQVLNNWRIFNKNSILFSKEKNWSKTFKKLDKIIKNL
jgi:glycosyltransferase involved in cell wall biosynthesis